MKYLVTLCDKQCELLIFGLILWGAGSMMLAEIKGPSRLHRLLFDMFVGAKELLPKLLPSGVDDIFFRVLQNEGVWA